MATMNVASFTVCEHGMNRLADMLTQAGYRIDVRGVHVLLIRGMVVRPFETWYQAVDFALNGGGKA